MTHYQWVVPPMLLAEVLGWLQDQSWAAPFIEVALGARPVAGGPKHRLALCRGCGRQARAHRGRLAHRPAPRRQLFLEKLLLTDPAHAARLLADALSQEAAATQVALLGALDALPLAPPLPADFAPALAPLLASRGKEVRQTAARWLARVADSPLLPRLWTRAEPLVQVKHKVLGRAKLIIALPPAWSAEWQRDGIAQKTSDYAGGEKAGQLGQLLALRPPGRWAAAWGVPAAETVALAAASDWAAVLLPAWLRAARLHHNADFALALLLHEASQPSLPPRSRLIVEASGVLSPDQKTTWLLATLPAPAATLPASSAWAHWLPLCCRYPS